MLVIDETVTAVRCGAPFAHQRPEYKAVGKPDLVFFGKGLCANGIAINFDGPYLERLNIRTFKKKRQAIHDWQAVVTQALHLPLLIEALGVLEMAMSSHWVDRSIIIGQQLRKVVRTRAESSGLDEDDGGQPLLGGLESFIFVRKDIAATFLVMGASNAGPWVRWVRWMPRLDRQLTSISVLESIMSPTGGKLRRCISQCLEKEGLTPQWCFYCGNKAGHDSSPRWCRSCCIDVCNEAECIEQLLAHRCLDLGATRTGPGPML
ncbi:hypothetical protein ABEF95_005479 [Exophiala dermatitidis]